MTRHVIPPTNANKLPPEVAVAVHKAMRDVLVEHGLGAFAMPKRAACVHESGHGIVAHAMGVRMRHVRVWMEPIADCADEVWTGWCQTSRGLIIIDDHSRPAKDLAYAKYLVAGLAAEAVAGCDLPGSSLDELVSAQAITARAVEKMHRGLEPVQLAVIAKGLWEREVWGGAVAILQANWGAVEILAEALNRIGEVRGRLLRTVLSKVAAL